MKSVAGFCAIVMFASLAVPRMANAWSRDEPAAGGESTLARVESAHLPNLIRVQDKVLSGGLPEGDEAFAELESLGVRTIISVDGAKPDVELARRHGLRYVHLPHGYDGISAERAGELAKAVRDLEGPIYIHCHHGKHRSPAAAAVACVAAGLIEPTRAIDVLRLAGTSEHYKGLYAAADKARPLDARELDELNVEFPEVAEIPPLAEAMVEIEHVHDRLKTIEAAGWMTPPDQPDLLAEHEALLLREHFTEILRTDDVMARPEGFVQLTRDGEAAATSLENRIREWQSSGVSKPPKSISTTFLRVSQNCTSCHRQYRDVPRAD